jgi:hypothetical protein
MVINLLIIMLWEDKVSTKKDASEKVIGYGLDLSGAQAEIAIDFALNNKIKNYEFK